jgi:hypothetical protein
VANLVGLPKDLTTERTEITEKNLLKFSVGSVISVVRGFLSPSFSHFAMTCFAMTWVIGAILFMKTKLIRGYQNYGSAFNKISYQNFYPKEFGI